MMRGIALIGRIDEMNQELEESKGNYNMIGKNRF
jgi:hypothetical protein